MKIIEHINYLIRAAHKSEVEDLKLKKEYELDSEMVLRLSSSKVVEYVFEDRPEKTKIEEYLKKLDYDVLLKLETIMYFGRGDNDNFDNISKYLASLNDSKEEIIRTIIEKRLAYPIYFLRAIERLKAQGLDIETL